MYVYPPDLYGRILMLLPKVMAADPHWVAHNYNTGVVQKRKCVFYCRKTKLYKGLTKYMYNTGGTINSSGCICGTKIERRK